MNGQQKEQWAKVVQEAARCRQPIDLAQKPTKAWALASLFGYAVTDKAQWDIVLLKKRHKTEMQKIHPDKKQHQPAASVDFDGKQEKQHDDYRHEWTVEINGLWGQYFKSLASTTPEARAAANLRICRLL